MCEEPDGAKTLPANRPPNYCAKMGNRVVREDFEWVYTDQPHADRRKEILGESLSLARSLTIKYTIHTSPLVHVSVVLVCFSVVRAGYQELGSFVM